MNDLRKNGSGYVDKTAERAITSVIRADKYDKREHDVTKTVNALKAVCEAAGFKLSNRVHLIDLGTGKEYR